MTITDCQGNALGSAAAVVPVSVVCKTTPFAAQVAAELLVLKPLRRIRHQESGSYG
ncbi:hypothetical protein ACLK1T_15300 [Escherichia coli]